MWTKSPMIFINVPVTNLTNSLTFYTSRGFVQNQRFSDATTAMVSLAPMPDYGSGYINVMLMHHDRFKSFLPSSRQICDAKGSTEVILCLSAESRVEVDAVVQRAKDAGSELDVVPIPEMEGMYGRSFTDPDGHIWEVMWMSEEAVKGHGEGKGE
jgi:uncharacterized protein